MKPPFLTLSCVAILSRIAATIIVALGILAAATSGQAVPNVVNYQGQIEVGGLPYDGSGEFKFALVNAAGDTALWTNDGTSGGANLEPTASVSLTVVNGVFATLLGETPTMNAIPSSVFADNDEVFLRVWFDDGSNGSQQLTPDRRIAAVGFAIVAGGVSDDAITTDMLADGSVTNDKLATGLATPWMISGGDISFSSGDVGVSNLNLPATTSSAGIIRSGTSTLLHTFGDSNMFSGIDAGNLTMSGGFNTGIGERSLLSNTTGTANTAIGEDSLNSNTVGGSNTAIGQDAMKRNVDGSFNTALGQASLASNTSGSANTGLGEDALKENTTGGSNTAVGQASLRLNETGSYNTGLGQATLSDNTTGSFNTAVGEDALADNTTGDHNTAVGEDALARNTTGLINTALGADAMFANTTGSYNVAVGEDALHDNVSADNNTSVGVDSLRANTGAANIALGFSAGSLLTTGSNNIMIGHQGTAGEAGTIRIGDSNQSRAFLAGVHGVTTGLSGALQVVVDSNGQLGTSSGTSAPPPAGQEDWTPATLQNGWSNSGNGFSEVAFFKDSMGIVHLRGVLSGGASGQPMLTLPAGYRPEARKAYATYGCPFLEIKADGTVRDNSAAGGDISLDGVTFRAAP